MPTGLKAEKSRIKVSEDSVSGEHTAWFISSHLSAASLHGRKGRGAFCDLFDKEINPTG
jgi:hypothetical protein